MGASVRPTDDPALRLQYYKETGQHEEAAKYEQYLKETGQHTAGTLAPLPRTGSDATASRLGSAPPQGGMSPGRVLNGLTEQVNQGGTFGFSDELAALAAGVVSNPLHPLKNFEKLRQQYVAGTGAADVAKEHPILSAVANVAGGMAGGGVGGAMANTVLGPLKSAPAVGSALVRGAKAVGAGMGVGGAAAFGSADGSMADRAKAVPGGVAYGGAFAGGLGLLGAAGRATGITPALQRLVPRPETGESLAGRAMGSLGMSSKTDLVTEDLLHQLSRGDVTPEAALAAHAAAPDMMLLDPSIGGRSMRRRARGAQSIPSAGSDQMERALVERGAGQPARVQSALESGLGATRENTVTRANQLAGDRSAAAYQNYANAYAAPPIEDPKVLSILHDPVFQQAHEIGRRMAAREGVELPPLTKTTTVDGKTVTEAIPQPVQAFDWMKHGLDDLIETGTNGQRTMGRNEARITRNKLSRALELIDADPKYADYASARADFRNRSQIMAAGESGLDFLKTPRDQVAATFPSLPAEAQHEYRRNALAAIEEQLGKVTDGRDVTRIFQNPLIREKMETIFPDADSFAAFARQMAGETEKHQSNQFVLSGSPTARIEAEQADGLGEGVKAAAKLATGNPEGILHGLVHNALTNRLRGLSEEQVNLLAPLLTAHGDELTKVLTDLKAYQARQAVKTPLLTRSVAQTAGASRWKP